MDVKKPAEKASELANEADRGRSERTPWLALGGVGLTITFVVAILLIVLLLIYWIV